MRIFWLLVVLGLGAWIYFAGIRLGLVTITPAWMINAQGNVQYAFQLLPSDNGGASFIRIAGTCDARAGTLVLSMTAPDGESLGSQQCHDGRYSLNLTGSGQNGTYLLTAAYRHYTGSLQLSQQRQ